jgi:phosphoglycerate dehydrogenase-like enzyme
LKVLIAVHHRFQLWNAPQWLALRLKERFPEHTFTQIASLENLSKELEDTDILIGYQLRPEQLAHARRLKYIHTTTAAVHQLMFPELIASDVRITNSAEIHGSVVAEHAIALIFALAKAIPASVKYQLKSEWGQQELWNRTPPREIAGATLLVIGLGSIGNEIARMAKALGMHVIAIREHLERGAGHADEVYGPQELNRLLARADYVVLSAPLTGKTEALFNEHAFAQMRKTAFFINVSRGPLVDEAALARALRERVIAGAALDVFSVEPLPPESPLWKLENLLITPHTAALTDKLWERHFARITENLRRYFAGLPLLGEVDKRRGY